MERKLIKNNNNAVYSQQKSTNARKPSHYKVDTRALEATVLDQP